MESLYDPLWSSWFEKVIFRVGISPFWCRNNSFEESVLYDYWKASGKSIMESLYDPLWSSWSAKVTIRVGISPFWCPNNSIEELYFYMTTQLTHNVFKTFPKRFIQVPYVFVWNGRLENVQRKSLTLNLKQSQRFSKTFYKLTLDVKKWNVYYTMFTKRFNWNVTKKVFNWTLNTCVYVQMGLYVND